MPAENNIVSFWLESENYSFIEGLNAGKRVVDFIAFKDNKAYHIEVAASLHSRKVSEELNSISARFDDVQVIKKIKEKLKFYSLSSYNKILITNFKADKAIDGISIMPFETIAMKVLKSLDRQNYEETTKRTMQIVKYIILRNPKAIDELLRLNMLGGKAKRNIVNAILEEKYIEKNASKDTIDEIMQQISKRPDNTAIIAGAVNNNFNKRMKRGFASALLENSDSRNIMKTTIETQKRISEY